MTAGKSPWVAPERCHAEEILDRAGTSLSSLLHYRATLVESYLKHMGTNRDIPSPLRQAMDYSLLAGGKRLRPVLCLSAALACSAPVRRSGDGIALKELNGLCVAAMPFAAALEMIHTYSLIHDDLPAMDDDDLRRGIPTNHKKFGEGTAILAGDGLLTDAFALMASCPIPAQRLLEAIRLVAEAAGSEGMVGGQMLDLEAEGRTDMTLAELRDLNARKTGALLRCACETGAVLAGATPEQRRALRLYGAELGMAFQITDDVLDVVGSASELGKAVGHDAVHGKATWPALMGVEAARDRASEHCANARRALPESLFTSADGEYLRLLVDAVAQRNF